MCQLWMLYRSDPKFQMLQKLEGRLGYRDCGSNYSDNESDSDSDTVVWVTQIIESDAVTAADGVTRASTDKIELSP